MSKILEIDFDKLPSDLTIVELIMMYQYQQDEKYISGSTQIFNELEEKKYIKWTDEGIILRQKALDVISLVKVKENNPVKELVESKDDIEEWIEEYRDLFKSTGPGKTADVKTLIKKMKWFYKEYPELADKSLILNATERYISTESLSSYRYLQRADYFISKEDSSKIKVSRLASYCQDILDEDNLFKDDNELL